jgi:reductive dehalogenase
MIIIYIIVPLALLLLLLFIPLKGKSYKRAVPVQHADERDIMFARNDLKPGSERFNEYYKRNSDKLKRDNSFRSKPGLLSHNSIFYDRYTFASAHASFEAVSGFFPFREQDKRQKVKEDRALRIDPVDQFSEETDCRGDREDKKQKDKEDRALRIDPVDQFSEETDCRGGQKDKSNGYDEAVQLTKFLKGWGKKLGALDVGIAKTEPYHFYTVAGRGSRYGDRIVNDHPFGIVFTVEMDYDLTNTAPKGGIVMESAHQYLNSAMIATQVALTLRELGYSAKTHIDGNYDLICPVIAKDAGLGEIGRMGLLITPKNGPRVRIAVVTTDAPLVADKPSSVNSVIDFCTRCKKCAIVCPSAAIPKSDRKDVEGGLRWKIDQDACFSYWCQAGTDCGKCMAVCPYSHKSNMLHNFIRWGIRNNYLFRRLALRMDDVIYGRGG